MVTPPPPEPAVPPLPVPGLVPVLAPGPPGHRPPGRLPHFVVVLVVISVTVNLLLAIGFVWIGTVSIGNQGTIHANEIQQCHDGNATRLEDIAIWHRLLKLPAHPAPSAAQVAEVAALNHLVAVKDTPKDCAKAYSPATTGK